MLKKIPKMLEKNFQKLQGKFTITKLTPNLLEEVPVEEVKDLHDEGINVVALPNKGDNKQLN